MPVLDTESPAEPRRGSPPRSAGSGRSLPLAVLETMRPKQWSKNAFVLAGLLFSGEVVHLDAVLPALVVAVAFCLVSGATYLLNDAIDAEADRHNPRTASRPIARGDLSPRLAIGAASLAALAGACMAAAINWGSLVTLLGYVVLQIAYSN
ncbi:MAG: UbiA family prenyltransferase, partial [Actinomycetota bacterium]|nr:UbiA family prenyltransferase [Actinomycetota bacterium]